MSHARILILASLIGSRVASGSEVILPPGGLELALSVGAAFPLGYPAGTGSLPPSPANRGFRPISEIINPALPFGILLGYRYQRVISFDATFSYGAFGSPNKVIHYWIGFGVRFLFLAG